MKGELGEKIMTKLVGLKTKSHSYLIDDSSEDKKNGAEKCVIKRKLKFENYKNFLEATQLQNKMNLKVKGLKAKGITSLLKKLIRLF